MAIDNRYDQEDVDGAMSSNGGDNHLYLIKSYHNTSTYREAISHDTQREVNREVNLVDQDSTDAANLACNHESDWLITEADSKDTYWIRINL
jgi:hypothetical protein